MVDKKILITGGSGMVGHSIKSILPDATYISSSDYDLRDMRQVERMYSNHEPHKVIHLAAKVGGVKSNSDNVGDFFRENILINTHVLEGARAHGVEKVISLLSTCVYPDKVNYPLTENQFHAGPPHFSNFGYAYAKRMIDVMSRAYRHQYGCNFITAIPNNLYGNNDNYDIENGHVIPALMHKIWKANKQPFVECWGNGSSLREFTHSDDIAKILLFLLESYDSEAPINIGNVEEVSIKQVAEMLCEFLGFKGNIFWNTQKPSGQHRKPSDNSRLVELGWNAGKYVKLQNGLKSACEWFMINYPNVRGVA